MAWFVFVAHGSMTGIYPWFISCFFVYHSLWWDALLSLDSGGRALSNINLICLSLSYECTGGVGEEVRLELEEGKDFELCLVCKMNSKLKIKIRIINRSKQKFNILK